jgi:hypothetical protein
VYFSPLGTFMYTAVTGLPDSWWALIKGSNYMLYTSLDPVTIT